VIAGALLTAVANRLITRTGVALVVVAVLVSA